MRWKEDLRDGGEKRRVGVFWGPRRRVLVREWENLASREGVSRMPQASTLSSRRAAAWRSRYDTRFSRCAVIQEKLHAERIISSGAVT